MLLPPALEYWSMAKLSQDLNGPLWFHQPSTRRFNLTLKSLIANLALLTFTCASQNTHACGPVQVTQLRMGLSNYLSQGTKTPRKSKPLRCEVGMWSSGAMG